MIIVIPTCQRVALIQETMEPMPFPIQYQLFPYSSTIPFITLLGWLVGTATPWEKSAMSSSWLDSFTLSLWSFCPWLVQFPLYLSICLQSPAHCAHTYIHMYIYIYICMIHICTHYAHAYMYMIVYVYHISLHCRHRHWGSASGWGRAGSPIKWRNAPVHPRNCRSKELNHEGKMPN